MRQKQTIAITATFTAEPVEESLAFWMQELDIPSKIEFAPYNQVFQQLLDPSSLLSKNRFGINIVLVRLDDWERSEDSAEAGLASSAISYEKIKRNVQDLVHSFKFATERSSTPYLVCLCSASNATVADPNRMTFFEQMEALMKSELDRFSGIYLITISELAATYPVSTYYDPYGDELGHIPFARLFFTALGTFIARKIYAIQSAPYKVIVLDCDETLWKGVCGEDGALGIEIDPPRKALQEFMVAQHDAGMLICLCSRNNEEDVVQVFEHRPGMPLKRDHIVSWRINWRPKSENIRSLADELQLGLDSFIFIDDDPVGCAEVQANCPEVLVLQLPQEPDSISRFPKHVWAFDHLKVTEEDKKRTVLYQQNIQRERSGNESLSLADFLAGLGLKVQISELMPHHVARVSQLTQRTNQFNCTGTACRVSTIRRSEGGVQEVYQSEEVECLVVEVSDRFGDYGLVGAIIFETESDAINVDTFLLSCRALGRGVEHRMLAKLGEIAKGLGLGHVNVTYIPTGKNQPALDFLDGVGAEFKRPVGDGLLFRFPVDFAAALTYRPDAEEPVRSRDLSDARPVSAPADARPGGRGLRAGMAALRTKAKSALLSRIATELYDAEQILNVIESQRDRARPELETTFMASRTPIEEILAGIWAQVLRLEQVGVHDNFFELGGHSLLAIQIISRVLNTFRVEVPIKSIFQLPTVADMAVVIAQSQVDKAEREDIDRVLAELEALSDEEAQRLLADERAERRK